MRRRDFIKAVSGAALASGEWLDLVSTCASAQPVSVPPVAAKGPDGPLVEIVPQLPHSGSIESAVFSSDGRFVISAGDKSLKLWSVDSGRLIRTLTGHDLNVWSVALSRGGAHAISGARDQTIRFWDLVTGKALKIFEGHTGAVTSVAFSSDEKRILSGGDDGTIRIWDVARGRPVLSLNAAHAKEATSQNARELSSVTSVAFSRDGKTIVSGGYTDRLVKLWDAATGRLIHIFKDHSEGVTAVAFSPNGPWIASVGGRHGHPGEVKLFDAVKRKFVRDFVGQRDQPKCVAFSPDGSRVYSGVRSSGGTPASIGVWETDSGSQIPRFGAIEGDINSIAFSPDGVFVLTGTGDRILRRWNTGNGEFVGVMGGPGIDPTVPPKDERESNYVESVAFSPRNGDRLLTAGYDKTAKLWRAASGGLLRSFSGHSNWVSSAAFSPNDDGARILTGSRDGSIKLWNASAKEPIRTMVHADPTAEERWRVVSSVAFTPDGTHALSGGWDGLAKLWDLATGKVAKVFDRHPDKINGVAFSRDGGRLLTACHDGIVRLWDVGTGGLIRPFMGHKNWVYSVAFSPNDDGARVLSGAWDNLVMLWDAETGKPLRPPLSGHSDAVTSVAFSPDGTCILSGSQDQTLRLWDLSTKKVTVFSGHSASVMSVAFSPDGKTVMSGSYDTTIRRWAIDGSLLTRSVATKSNDWVTIDERGFFDGSDFGPDLLSAAKGLSVYPISQFYQALYRPDVVRQRLSTDVNVSGRANIAARKVNLEKVLASGAPPDVTIVAPKDESVTAETAVTVEADLTAPRAGQVGGIGRVEWRVGDVVRVVQDLKRAPDGKVTKLRQQLALPEGTSTIKLVAYNRSNLTASLPASISITVKSAVPRPRPRLHVLAIGINVYRFSELNLKNAVADATSLSHAFLLAKSDKTLFEDVLVSEPMINQAVTVRDLQNKFTELGRNIRPDDVFVLYMAGHGVTDDGRYYFIPHDANYAGEDYEKLVATSIGQDQLQQWLTLIPAFQSVLIYDTCESGSIAENRLGFRDIQQGVATDKLSKSMGRTVLSATSDVKGAAEGYKGHGFFTYVLLDAFALSGDGKSPTITTKDIADHLEKNLPALTEKQLKPRQEPQIKLTGLPITLMPRASLAEIDRVRN